MRGKVCVKVVSPTSSGITPAYAGKSEECSKDCLYYGDHPRLCGEKEMKSSPMSSPIGSPPPMRGKVKFKTDLFSFSRITPAYAGKRSSTADISRHFGDHPRLCGEKLFVWKWKRGIVGSPPPMRGKGCDGIGALKEIRITPAYAGKRWL